MSFTIVCQPCQLQAEIPDNFQGRKVKCPRCGKEIPVVRPEGTPAPKEGRFNTRLQLIGSFFAGEDMPHICRPAPRPAPAAVAPAPSPEVEQGEQEWAATERQRMSAYAENQLARIKQQREELANWQSQVEASVIAREQEINRQMKLLAVREERASSARQN